VARLFRLIGSGAGAESNEAGGKNHEHEDGSGGDAVHLISPNTFIFSTQLESRRYLVSNIPPLLEWADEGGKGGYMVWVMGGYRSVT